MRADIALCRHDDFVADGDVLLGLSIQDAADSNALSGLFDRWIRFQVANSVLHVLAGEGPVIRRINSAANFYSVTGTLPDVDTSGTGSNLEIDRSRDIERFVE